MSDLGVVSSRPVFVNENPIVDMELGDKEGLKVKKGFKNCLL